jgi:uncharacterized protein (TIGR01777 family)
MKVAISGITGLVGHALAEKLLNEGNVVKQLLREDFLKGRSHLKEKLDEVNAVVNLAGAPIFRRWTAKWKDEIMKSRTTTTEMLVSVMNEMPEPPSVFISASAVGIYNIFEMHDEYSTDYADDFLGKVCFAWEGEALKVNSEKIKLSIIRLGLVLSTDGGALKQMLLPFKLGIGGKIGNGLQPMPYIHIDDLVRGIYWILKTPGQEGIYNMVAPQMILNAEFTRALSATLRRPAFFTIPGFVLKFLFREAACVLLKGQKVIPRRLPESGFEFNFPDIRLALGNLLK